tara:strand:+ start:75 stop:911 length:837 start_codon:yes stop_codon:yes gene_type:complete
MDKIFLFVLAPPYHASNIIKLLNTSNNVSMYKNNGMTHLLYNNDFNKQYNVRKWDPEYKLNMNNIYSIFNFNLDPKKTIWVDASAPTICRAKQFQSFLKNKRNVYFVVVMSHPYSKILCNSQWVECAKYQKQNLTILKNTIYVRYEDCCNNINKVILQLSTRIPGLMDLNNNIKSEPVLYNQIYNKEAINKDLYDNYDLLQFFGYNMMHNKIYESKDAKFRGFYNEVMEYNIKHNYEIELELYETRYNTWYIEGLSEASKLAADQLMKSHLQNNEKNK